MIEASERRSHIESKLQAELGTEFIEVVDESHLHAGHAGAREGGGHFRATIVSGRFEGLGRVAAQRLVYQILADEMKGDIHALAIKTFTPEQYRSQARERPAR
jgi:BolA protein